MLVLIKEFVGTAFLAHLVGLRCKGELLWSVAKELVPKALNWLEELVKAFSLKRTFIGPYSRELAARNDAVISGRSCLQEPCREQSHPA